MAARVKSDCFQNIQNAFCENTTLSSDMQSITSHNFLNKDIMNGL